MEKSFLLRSFLFLSLVIFLLFPYLYLSTQVPFQWIQWDPFLFRVLQGALLQAGLGTLLTLILGLASSFGLFWLKAHLSSTWFQLVLFLCLMPSFLPPILIVVLGAKGAGGLITGLSGVVFFHLLMNLGLISVLFFGVISGQAQNWIPTTLVAGVPKSRFIFSGLLPGIRPALVSFGFYFFLLYFFSFSIPLLVGGRVYGGVEVFIYEKIVLFGEWSEALQYSFLFFILVLLCSPWLDFKSGDLFQKTQYQKVLSKYLGNFWMVLGILIPIFIVFWGGLKALLASTQGFQYEILPAMRNSLLMGLSVGLLCFILLSAISFCFAKARWGRIIAVWMHPGWVVVGFAFLLLGDQGPVGRFLKLALVLSLIYFPYLYRMYFHQSLNDVDHQVNITRNFPTPWGRVFGNILWPQLLPRICFLSGMAGAWACGDFAMAGLLLDPTESMTLGLAMKELLGSYRLESALTYVGPLLFCAAVVFFVFQGLYYVSRKKTFS